MVCHDPAYKGQRVLAVGRTPPSAVIEASALMAGTDGQALH
jgi:hypothetical protein